MSEAKQVRVIITGLVQGVFFRAGTRDAARALNLRGRVWNNPDGTVEAVFIGSSADIDRAIEWCRQGPDGSRVDEINIKNEPLRDEALTDFTIEYGA